MINRKIFYDNIRPLFKDDKIMQPQVEGIEAILDEWEKRELTDLRWLAYILATVFHETGKKMQPVREGGRGKGHKYGIEHPGTKQTYYGRGLIQITWDYNYLRFGKILDIDLYANADLALDMNVSIQILFIGMLKGMFTGVMLSQFFNEEKEEWTNARKIVNGLDKAGLIAGYAHEFHNALKSETKTPT